MSILETKIYRILNLKSNKKNMKSIGQLIKKLQHFENSPQALLSKLDLSNNTSAPISVKTMRNLLIKWRAHFRQFPEQKFWDKTFFGHF